MKRITPIVATTALLGLSIGASAAPIYTANLGQLNNSSVTGNATLTYDSTASTLNVMIQASGLEAGMPHPAHIHGVIGGNSVSPTMANDSDGDGYVELAEARPSYGPILLPLSSPPGGAVADFPTASDGTISFSQTYDLSSMTTFADGYDQTNLFPFDNREVVLHGMTLAAGEGADGGEADGTAGYKATLPVASGVITAQAQAVPEPGDLAMFVLGAGLIGGLSIARKRRNDTSV